MALHIFSAIVSTIPSSYYFPAVVIIILLVIGRAYTQGRRTNRDRDLNARTVILTGAFTPLGLTLLEFLAKKGAHIIALVPTPSLTSHHDEILTLLRSTTSNESIYAEPCPLDSPSEIKRFCERFVNTENEKDRRVDALIMAHEYAHIGTWSRATESATNLRNEESMKRDEGAMATFLLTTLLLPALLVSPTERDIRVINIVNPFYAAAAPAFNPRLSSSTYNTVCQQKVDYDKSKPIPSSVEHHSSWGLEGLRALRTAVFTRHLQRILDALPEPGTASTDSSSGTRPSSAKNDKPQQSNILAITVSPGISRTDTIAPYLLPPVSSHGPSATRQWVGVIVYILFLPLLHLLTKTPTSALQSVIHALCLPKPHTRRRIPAAEDVAQPPPKSRPQISPRNPDGLKPTEEEVLVPGALYADCSVVKLDLRISKSLSVGIENQDQCDVPEQFGLGLGNEPLGRAVWEALEDGVRIWEQREISERKHRTH